MTVYGWPKVKLFYYIIIKSAFHCFLQLGDICFSSWDIIFFVTSGFRESKALSVGHISKRFELKNSCILMMLSLDSAGFWLVGSSNRINTYMYKCFIWAKLNLYRNNRKRIEWNLTYELTYKIQIYCCIYNLMPRTSCLSDIGRDKVFQI